MYKTGLVFLIWVFLNLASGDQESPIVEIDQGFLRGVFLKTRLNRTINAFMSIPYAKPPIGQLRFEPPQPANPWEGILDASVTHAVCPQKNHFIRSQLIEGDEDCLYLNVYTPKLKGDLLPVLIFLHGGGWYCGGGNIDWYGPGIFLDRDVVLVVPNFRLGPFGFLSTGDEIVPGNNGLKDQNLALKWVQRNIEKFGGHPKKVTLFGESAGAVSTHLHMLTPASKGLFHRAISQSGTALAPWAVVPPGETAENSKRLAKLLHCPTSSSKEMIECLRKVDAYEIITQEYNVKDWDSEPMITFPPVIEPDIEGAFLTEHPADTIKMGKSAPIPWMTGLNSEDGALKAAIIYGNPHLLEDFDRDFNKIVAVCVLHGSSHPNTDAIANEIRKFYFGNKKLDNSSRFDLIDLFSDAWFSIDDAVRLQAAYSKAPVYTYLFGHRGVASFSQLFGDPSQNYGVCHADELQYLFPVGDILFPTQKPDDKDKIIAELMTTLWANFAKYGDPTPEVNSVVPTKWLPVQTKNYEFFDIRSPSNVRMNKHMFYARMQFWRSLPTHPKISHSKDEL